MSSEYLSPIWKRLGDALSLKDQRGISNRISNTPVTPVLNLDAGMFSYTPVSAGATFNLVAPQASIAFAIVSPIIQSFPNQLGSFPNNLELETLILGYQLAVDMSGLGSTEDLNWVDVYCLWGESPSIPTGLQSRVQRRWGFFDWANGKTRVATSMGPAQQRSDGALLSSISAEKPIWVPAGGGFQVVMELSPVDNFSAGCAIYAQAIGVQFPKGMRGPLM